MGRGLAKNQRGTGGRGSSAWDRPLRLAIVLGLTLGITSPSWARRTSQPLYEDPFDIAAGGASLTFAAKEGRLFSNPALLPYGGRFHQWAGSTSTILVNRESLETAQGLLRGSSQGASAEAGDQVGDQAGGGLESGIAPFFEAPLRMGWAQALSWLTSGGALSLFSRFEADIRGLEYGDYGLPQVEFKAENYQGIAFGTAWRLPWPWLAMGASAKGLSASEPEATLAISDTEALKSFKDPSYWRSLGAPRQGFGFDGGALLFLQGQHVDWKMGLSVTDVGSTVLTSSDGDPITMRQVTSVGTGLTFHTGADALHFAVDQRDIGRVYGEEAFKRWRLGVRLTLRTYVGLAAGYYDGNPSMGAEIDLIVLRLAATVLKRELGDRPGVNARNMMLLSLSAGF